MSYLICPAYFAGSCDKEIKTVSVLKYLSLVRKRESEYPTNYNRAISIIIKLSINTCGRTEVSQ